MQYSLFILHGFGLYWHSYKTAWILPAVEWDWSFLLASLVKAGMRWMHRSSSPGRTCACEQSVTNIYESPSECSLNQFRTRIHCCCKEAGLECPVFPVWLLRGICFVPLLPRRYSHTPHRDRAVPSSILETNDPKKTLRGKILPPGCDLRRKIVIKISAASSTSRYKVSFGNVTKWWSSSMIWHSMPIIHLILFLHGQSSTKCKKNSGLCIEKWLLYKNHSRVSKDKTCYYLYNTFINVCMGEGEILKTDTAIILTML